MSQDEKKAFEELVDDLFYNVMSYCRTDMTLMFKTLENFGLNHKDEIQSHGCKENIINEMVELSPDFQHYRSTLQQKQNLKVWRFDRYFQNILDNEQILKEVMNGKGESDCKLAFLMKEKFKEKWNTWLENYSNVLQIDQEKFKEKKMAVSWEFSRTKMMRENNPWFQLRNYLMENAIKLAENGDYTEVWKLYGQCINPYDHEVFVDTSTGKLKKSIKKYCSTPPAWAHNLVLSCSS